MVAATTTLKKCYKLPLFDQIVSQIRAYIRESMMMAFSVFYIALLIKKTPKIENYLRDHETTILHILGTEILGLFQIDLLSNFMLELTTEHIPALSGRQFCCFLAIRKRLILKYRKFYEKEKFNFVNVIIG